MSKHDLFMSLWNFMEISEKQRLMRQFLKQHGDHFSTDDFVRFLSMRYDGIPLDLKQMNRDPENRRQPES